MRIQSLEHFVALAHAGSFYQAAKRSSLSVQGYAKMLASLEGELGTTLATRSKSGIRLTQAGEILLEEAQRIIEKWNRVENRLDELKEDPDENSERIRVFTTHYGMQVISQLESMLETLSGYDLHEDAFDRILIRAEQANPNEVLIADAFDDEAIARMESRGIAFEVFYEAAIGLVVRDDCPLAQRDAVSVSDIDTLKMANYLHKERNQLIEKALGRQLARPALFESTALNLLTAFVKTAPDHGVLADSLIIYGLKNNPVYDLADLRFVPLKNDAVRLRLGMLYREDRASSSIAPSFIGPWHDYAQTKFADYFEELARIDRTLGQR